jgi:hypothetical protein
MYGYSGSVYSRSTAEARFRALGLVIRTVEEWDEHASPSPNLAVAQALKEAHDKVSDLERELDYQVNRHIEDIKRRNAEWWGVVRKLVSMTAGQ